MKRHEPGPPMDLANMRRQGVHDEINHLAECAQPPPARRPSPSTMRSDLGCHPFSVSFDTIEAKRGQPWEVPTSV